jgi:hypothetical protein
VYLLTHPEPDERDFGDLASFLRAFIERRRDAERYANYRVDLGRAHLAPLPEPVYGPAPADADFED